jgi:hypothetical protein
MVAAVVLIAVQSYDKVMRSLLKRWWFWLGAFIILGLFSAGLTLIVVSRSEITQAKFDRIQEGMTEDEVINIIGEGPSSNVSYWGWFDAGIELTWCKGPDLLQVTFIGEKVARKDMYLATIWERLHWQSRQLLKKIGL